MERVTLWGWLDFAGKDVSPILKGATDLIAAAYDEPGCIHYVWTADPLRPERMWVYEEWENVDALRGHLDGEPYRGMADYLISSGMSGAEVDKYRVDRKEPVYDGSGRPKPDFG